MYHALNCVTCTKLFNYTLHTMFMYQEYEIKIIINNKSIQLCASNAVIKSAPPVALHENNVDTLVSTLT